MNLSDSLQNMLSEVVTLNRYCSSTALPGMFTSKTCEESVQPAIEPQAKGRREQMERVLIDSGRAYFYRF